jgi:hypothetical protein
MNRNQDAPRKRPASLTALLLLVLAGTLVSTTGSRAAEWVERPFEPPAGSRWIIQSNETTEESRDGRVQTSVATSTSELTIEQKLVDGFRITYVMRNAAYEGNARSAALIGPVTKTLENLVVHATTAANGMPLRIETLDQVHATARTAIDNLTAPLASKPEEAAILRQMATRLLLADDQHAPAIYLASLVALALGQNTGLRPGETRNNDDDATNPFSGAPIKSNTSLRIDNADPATGTVRYIRTRSFDSDAIKAFLSGLAQQLGGADSKHSQQIDNVMKQFTMTLDSRTEIKVEEGMTRTLRQEETAAGGTPGRSIVKHGHKLIMVTRAP